VLHTLAVTNYRSLRELVMPLQRLNLITGANGSGKSSVYRALRLLAETAQGGVVNALAREGGLESTFWAGPEAISRRMRAGDVPVQGTRTTTPKRLKLGFAGDDFGYAIALGLPIPSLSAFALDPEIKHECIWAAGAKQVSFRPASALTIRDGPVVKLRGIGRDDSNWRVSEMRISPFDSLFGAVADPDAAPEVFAVRESIRSWRFYDHFRTDADAPARMPQLGTRTPVLHHDGRDLAAALQTIREIGDGDALDAAVADAFPGARVSVASQPDGRFALQFEQHGLLRPLGAAELSDGTIRYLLWIAALLSPRPPTLMVLNEPETSLHPDLLPPLARLIHKASEQAQVWVVSHAKGLIDALRKHRECNSIELIKDLGETTIDGQAPLDKPSWHWPE
jgi:predicted ATPase